MPLPERGGSWVSSAGLLLEKTLESWGLGLAWELRELGREPPRKDMSGPSAETRLLWLITVGRGGSKPNRLGLLGAARGGFVLLAGAVAVPEKAKIVKLAFDVQGLSPTLTVSGGGTRLRGGRGRHGRSGDGLALASHSFQHGECVRKIAWDEAAGYGRACASAVEAGLGCRGGSDRKRRFETTGEKGGETARSMAMAKGQRSEVK